MTVQDIRDQQVRDAEALRRVDGQRQATGAVVTADEKAACFREWRERGWINYDPPETQGAPKMRMGEAKR